jgi:diacylglycerol O-acyltransferase
MEKLSFQDASFLRLESDQRPFHVAGLMIFKPPEKASPNFMRKLARHCGRLNELGPVFAKKLKDPFSLRNMTWVAADDYDAKYHVHHYALPSPGRMEDLLTVVSRVHERLLDRSRPLWELHLIEGLPGGRFALYCKVHHALIDGVGALQMVSALFTESPDKQIDFRSAAPIAKADHEKLSLAKQFSSVLPAVNLKSTTPLCLRLDICSPAWGGMPGSVSEMHHHCLLRHRAHCSIAMSMRVARLSSQSYQSSGAVISSVLLSAHFLLS